LTVVNQFKIASLPPACVKMVAMLSGDQDLPVVVETEAGALISDLREAGWTVSGFRYDANYFGNWYVDLFRAGLTIRLVKDRSQYMIDGPPSEEIKAAGLWRAFDDLEEFRRAIIKWATNADVSIGDTGPSN
jgi:hypothetical protein